MAEGSVVDAVESVVQRAIEEWAAIGGGPQGDRGEPSLAHYIAASLGPEVSQSTQEYLHRFPGHPRADGFNPFTLDDACDGDD